MKGNEIMKKEITLSEEQLAVMLERASHQGARRALAEIGLHDEHAEHDIRDLRDLMASFRIAKTVAFRTFIRWLTIGVLTLILAGIVSTAHFSGK